MILFFKNLKIGTRFRFENDLKIYRKCTSYEAERFLKVSLVSQNQVCYTVEEDEIENSKLIIERSAESLRIRK